MMSAYYPHIYFQKGKSCHTGHVYIINYRSRFAGGYSELSPTIPGTYMAAASQYAKAHDLRPGTPLAQLAEHAEAITRLFNGAKQRGKAREALKRAGFSPQEVSALMPAVSRGGGKAGQPVTQNLVREVLDDVDPEAAALITSASILAENDGSSEAARRMRIHRFKSALRESGAPQAVVDLAASQNRERRERVAVTDAKAILADGDPETAAYLTALYIVDNSPDSIAARDRLSHLRRALRELGAPPDVVSLTRMPDVTKAANDEQKRRLDHRVGAGLDMPDSFTPEAIMHRLQHYDVEYDTPSYSSVADIMAALSLRPSELMRICLEDKGVTGCSKKKGDDRPMPLISILPLDRARELLEWNRMAVVGGHLEDPGRPGAKSLNKHLKPYNILPSDLRKIGAELAVRASHAKNATGEIRVRAGALRHVLFGRAVDNYGVVNR